MKTDKIVRIGCIGDSITAGTGLEDPKKEAFPAQLEKLLGENVSVFNFGSGGKTMRNDLGVDSYVNSNPYQSLLEIAHELDIVTIMLGTNDAYHAKGWTDYEKNTFKNDCRSLVATLSDKNPNVRFVIMNSPECFGEKASRYDMSPLRILQGDLVKELCEIGYKTDFFDMYEVTKTLGEHFPDKLHPDKVAHLAMAEALGALLKEILTVLVDKHITK